MCSMGEPQYKLRDAQELRIKVMRLAERIDLYRYLTITCYNYLTINKYMIVYIFYI